MCHIFHLVSGVIGVLSVLEEQGRYSGGPFFEMGGRCGFREAGGAFGSAAKSRWPGAFEVG